MSKIIVYTVIDNGIEGRSKDTIVFAEADETLRDDWFNKAKNKAWYRKSEQIVNVEVAKKEALSKLNGIEKMLLNL
jgi:hypothetical protein